MTQKSTAVQRAAGSAPLWITRFSSFLSVGSNSSTISCTREFSSIQRAKGKNLASNYFNCHTTVFDQYLWPQLLGMFLCFWKARHHLHYRTQLVRFLSSPGTHSPWVYGLNAGIQNLFKSFHIITINHIFWQSPPLCSRPMRDEPSPGLMPCVSGRRF